MKILNLLLSALFVVTSFFNSTFAQHTGDTIVHTDTVAMLQIRKNALHLTRFVFCISSIFIIPIFMISRVLYDLGLF